MNEFDRGHLVGYREGRNDILRCGLNEEKPSFLRDPARSLFVLGLLLFSSFLAWTHYTQTVRTLDMIEVVGANIDEAVWVIRLERLKEETENARLRRQLRERIRDLAPEVREEFAAR